jgi:hypothetical protein
MRGLIGRGDEGKEKEEWMEDGERVQGEEMGARDGFKNRGQAGNCWASESERTTRDAHVSRQNGDGCAGLTGLVWVGVEELAVTEDMCSCQRLGGYVETWMAPLRSKEAGLRGFDLCLRCLGSERAGRKWRVRFSMRYMAPTENRL